MYKVALSNFTEYGIFSSSYNLASINYKLLTFPIWKPTIEISIKNGVQKKSYKIFFLFL